jgi:hypothetical protein
MVRFSCHCPQYLKSNSILYNLILLLYYCSWYYSTAGVLPLSCWSSTTLLLESNYSTTRVLLLKFYYSTTRVLLLGFYYSTPGVLLLGFYYSTPGVLLLGFYYSTPGVLLLYCSTSLESSSLLNHRETCSWGRPGIVKSRVFEQVL